MSKNLIKKIMLIGQSGTGKTSMISYILKNGSIQQQHFPSVGVQAGIKTIQFQNNQFAVVQLWDTAGKHSFHQQICQKFYNQMDAFIILCDITNQNTLSSVNYWSQKIYRLKGNRQNLVIGVIANKADLQKHQFSEQTFKTRYPHLKYYGTISLKDNNKGRCTVQTAIQRFVRDVFHQNLPKIEISTEVQTKKTDCTCIIM